MIYWLHPAALVGLAAIAGPLLVHLLRRRRARPLSFPSLRFIVSGSTSSIRFQAPTDVPLLLLRIAVVGLAAAALAGPFVISPARQRTWAARLSRAIVIDSKISASAPAKEAVAAATRGPQVAVPVLSQSLKDGLRDALDVLVETPLSRREIVVVSDFRHGVLSAADIAAVPRGIGLRFISVVGTDKVAEFSGDVTLAGPEIPSRVQRIALNPTSTTVQWSTVGERREGLRVETAPNRAALLLRAVARAGAPAPEAAQPIGLAFRGNSRKGEKTLASWMLRTVLRMRDNGALSDAAWAHAGKGTVGHAEGVPIARSADNAVVVSAWRSGTELVLVVAGEPEDFLSTVTLHSALIARRGPADWNDREVARIPPYQLAAWTREPGTPDVRNTRPPSPGDARAVWAVVLGLLAGETWMRRRRGRADESRYADAA
jgi:hypothetical protein